MNYLKCNTCYIEQSDENLILMRRELNEAILCDLCTDYERDERLGAIDMQRTEAELYNWGKI